MSSDRAREGAARPRRSRFRPRALGVTLRGAGAFVVGVVALIAAYSGGWQEALVLASAALLLPVTGLVFARIARPRLEVVRVFSPPVVPAGTSVRVSLAVRNLAARPTVPGLWNDGLPWWEEAIPQRMPGLASATPGAASGRDRSAVFRYDLHPRQRGLYPVGPLAVEQGDPFGMARSVTAQGAQDTLVVVPPVVRLPPSALSTAEAEGEALLVQRRASGNDDDLTTREYRPGDALRRVHWRASAKHGDLMVRQEEQRSFPEVRLLLDTRRDGYPDAKQEPARFDDAIEAESDAFEWAITMFASIGLHLLEQGFHITVQESARAQVVPFGERWEGGRRDEGFLTSLAGIHLADPPIGDRPDDPRTTQVGPLFAVGGAPSVATVPWLRRQRRPGEVAVAFLAGEGTAESAAELRGAGWVVVESAADDAPEPTWTAAGEAWGALRGTR